MTQAPEMEKAVEALFRKACLYCAKGWLISDGDDGVRRGGRYHAINGGGGYVECQCADERAALSRSQAPVAASPSLSYSGREQEALAVATTTFDRLYKGNPSIDVALRAAVKAVLALPATPAGAGWQPIETAPKDGSNVLLFDADSGAVVGYWREDTSWREPGWLLVGGTFTAEPTHWQPRPATPAPAQEKAR